MDNTAKQTGLGSGGSARRLSDEHHSVSNPSLGREGEGVPPASTLGGDHTPHGKSTKAAPTGTGSTDGITQ